MRVSLLLILCFIYNISVASDFCKDLLDKVASKQAYIDNSKSIYIVSKKRLKFNSAPDVRCEMKNVFLIVGDRVTAYSEYKGYIYAAYFKENGDSVDGWLDSNGLKSTGEGNGPSSDEQMIVSMVPDVIKKYDLTDVNVECLVYEVNSNDKKYYEIYVSKNHKDKSCKNGKNIPFSILIEKNENTIFTNSGKAVDEFRRLD
jgi:hypothetical protein